MLRRGFVLVALLAIQFTVSLPAFAQVLESVAEAVEFRGYYVDEGLDLGTNDMERLVADHPGIGFVALQDDPPQGADLLANEILAVIEDPDTVIVLSASDAGVVTEDVYSDQQIQAALDKAFATSGDSYLTDFEELAVSLDTESVSLGTDAGGGFPTGWVIFAVLVIGVWLLILRGKKQRQGMATAQLDAAKSEIREQMAVVANEILEFSDRPDQDSIPEAVQHFRQASEVFKAAEDRMAASATAAQLESLSDDLDVARWEMAAAEALVEGRPVPPKPEADKPAPCFFDPTHGAGTEEAQLQTATGTRAVMVCAPDAERLRRGERPEPRSIDVGGRKVPAAQAPRSGGGGGMDWLDAFSILVGGMTRGTDYSWGRSRPRSGGFGGILGRSSSRTARTGGMPRLPSRRGSASGGAPSRRSRPSRSTARGRRSR